MRGFPKELNTKQDYLNCMDEYPQETKEALQLLLDNRYSWFRVREMAEGEEVPTGPYRAVEEKQGMEEESPVVRILEERREDPNSLLFIKGFTVKEVQDLIESLS